MVIMTEKKRFVEDSSLLRFVVDTEQEKYLYLDEVIDLLNEQDEKIKELEKEKGYWKSKAMTLLMQVRRLTPRMTDKEVIEFSKELKDE